MRTLIRSNVRIGISAIFYCLLGLVTLASADDQKLVFSVIGDIPYSKKEYKILLRHVEQHNKYSRAEFLVHVGDIRGTRAKCKESEYEQVASALLGLHVPALIVPGDNEWVDCKKPEVAWAYWTKNFIDFEKNFCGAPNVERQSQRPENFAFVKKGVLMIGINMVAGRNYDSKGKKVRLKDNAAWVKHQFDLHKDNVRAAVVFGHALRGSDGGFQTPFKKHVKAFGKPVAYIKGDDHSYSVKEKFLVKNLTKVVVKKGASGLPLEVTVTLDEKDPFKFNKKPWTKKSDIIDRVPCDGPNDDTEDETDDPVVVTQASFEVDPTSYNFGNVVVHKSEQKGFSLTNTGDLELAVTGLEMIGADAGVFKIESGGGAFLVGVGQTHSFVASFNPTASGRVKATLRIHFPDGAMDIDLLGTGKKIASGSEFTLTAVADAYIRSSKKSSNYGKSKSLTVRETSATYISYLKFEVAGLPDPVQSAVIRLVSKATADDGGSIYFVPDNGWDEMGINWSNAPDPAGEPLASVGAVSTGEAVELDVSEIVLGNGTYSFCIASTSTKKANYHSKENRDNKAPALLLSLTPRPAPQITSVDPTTGGVGTEVTIAGLHLDGASEVDLNGTPVPTFTVESDNRIRMRVPSGASSGKISVTTRGGVVNSDDAFEMIELKRYRFQVKHDTYVRSSKPKAEHGDAGSLQVRTSNAIRNVYLKFDVSGVDGVVQNAKVRLFAKDGSDQAGSIYSVSNNFEGTTEPWTEKDLNWNNAPAISGSPLSVPGAVIDDEIVEFDVAGAVSGNGIYSFAIADGILDRVKYRSKEKNRDLIPELVIETIATVLAKSSGLAAVLPVDPQPESESGELPSVLKLEAIYPNPFNIETVIQYSLPSEMDVSLVIFNIRGQHVRTLVNEKQEPGKKFVHWNGRNATNVVVATGTYVVRLQAGTQRFVQRVTLVK
ncbi:DNRLRE domain-containing protein [bacterium]|nr:DNRLRE domain-containing protein [bacterium]